MKTLLFSLILCFATMSGNALSFKIQGKITGLMPGDTLIFERISLPGFDLEFAFDVIVEKPDEFTYSGTHNHIGYYRMTYKPVGKRNNYSDRWGLTLLIKGGSTHLIGTADQIYLSQLQGGLYDNESLQEALQLDIALGKEKADLIKLMEEADVAQDTVKSREYMDSLNSFRSDRKEDFEKLSLLNKEFYEKYPSSEHTIVYALQRVNYTPYETSKERFEKMNDEARNGYFGKKLNQEVAKMALLQPGNKAPDFHLIGINGEEISLSDCAGSYVLIYHWGLCPGSLMINSEVIELYNKYKDHLIVIGITDRIDYIRSTYENAAPDSEVMGLELKPVLAGMLAHPWFDAEKTNDNGKIENDYAFAGYPYFVLISPDGNIIERDFHDAFYSAKERMESEFGD